MFRRKKSGERALENQRIAHRFHERDIWNFFVANAEAQVYALTKLRDNGHGYPGMEGAETPEEWAEILTVMIDGWQAILDGDEFDFSTDLGEYLTYQQACDARFKKSMALYVEWYHHLWD